MVASDGGASDASSPWLRNCSKHDVEECLGKYLSPITASCVLAWASRKLGHLPEKLDSARLQSLVAVLGQSLSLYLTADQKEEVLDDVRRLLGEEPSAVKQVRMQVTVAIRTEGDVALARAAALQMAQEAGFDKPDYVKVGTVASELARNILQYAKAGSLEVRRVVEPREGVQLVATDRGPGIPNLEQIMRGAYRSRTGMGLGLVGSKRLMDSFEVKTAAGKGTSVIARKYVQ